MNIKSVCVIGSCRVYSPVSLAIDNYRFETSHGKTDWFTHSTRDIIQKLKILDGKIKLDEMMIPLVINDLKKFHPATHNTGFFDNTDCFVIEVCSIQSNNYAGIELQQWCVRDIQVDGEKSDANIFSGLIRFHLTKENILADLESIYSYLNCKPILLVSHNMLKRPDGTIPKPRPIIMEALKTFASSKNNVSVFDPTPYIIDFGVEHAMKDPAHYKKEFEAVIGKAILNQLSTIAG